jgi:hypothetical protein
MEFAVRWHAHPIPQAARSSQGCDLVEQGASAILASLDGVRHRCRPSHDALALPGALQQQELAA